MKKIGIVANVPKNTLDELKAEILKVIQDKYGGEVLDVQVSDAAPKGAGATLAGVA